LAGYLVYPLVNEYKSTIKTREEVEELNGYMDIFEIGGTRKTHWRQPMSIEAADLRTAVRTSNLNVATVGSSQIPLYHLCLYYFAINALGTAIAELYTTQRLTKEALDELTAYFPHDRIASLISLLETICVR